MAIMFNPIALKNSMPCDYPIRIAGTLAGRTLPEALTCPSCGSVYDLIVPAHASLSEVETYTLDLRIALLESCGSHPPVLQKQ
jgi:hypothetical protein